ncbi:unnamed protein product [Rotaria sp. Silwood1]|nr:unnamed protein product [Rotaria sp. Silwood1]
MDRAEPRRCRFVNKIIADEPAIDNELTRLTPPITGYASEPLVTLEEACEPLEVLIKKLQNYVAMAKYYSQNPADNLSQDESAAIYLYTLEWSPSKNSLYIMLNRTLRAPDRSELTLKPWFKYLKLFLTALAKLPILSTSNRQPIVYRGIKMNIDNAPYTPGSFITWWAFSSCTTSISLLQSDKFLGTTGDRTIFNIETTTGKNISLHSHFGREDEVLLMPGTYMEVISLVNPAPQLHIIHLREKVPPVCLLEPPFEGTSVRLPHMYINILV